MLNPVRLVPHDQMPGGFGIVMLVVAYRRGGFVAPFWMRRA